MNDVSGDGQKPLGPAAWPRVVAAILLVTIIVGLMIALRGELQLSKLVQYESRLRAWQDQQPLLVFGVALIVYIVVTGFSIPIATGLSLLYGWYFGFWRGLLVVSFGSTAGATLAFLMSRYLLREIVQRRFGDRLQRFNEELEREGAFYLFTLRLLPIVPFFVVNAVMGLTPLRTRTFWWVSQIGMLPATMVYVYAGSTAPDLRTLSEQGVQALPVGQITLALVLLGLFPLATRLLVRRLKPSTMALDP